MPPWTHMKTIENINEKLERTRMIRKYLYEFFFFFFKVLPALMFVHL
jgi:hypothetical protein